MNILEFLKEHNVSINLKYFGPDDMSTGMEVKILIENEKIIRDYYNKIINTINTLDDYINYLYIFNIVKFKEIIPLVKDDLRLNFQELINYIEEVFTKYQEKDLVLFISNNYRLILMNEYEGLYIKHEVLDYTLQFIFKYNLKNEELIEFLITNFSYKILDQFDQFKKIINNSLNLYLYDLLLSEESLKANMAYRLERIENVLISLKKRDESKYIEKLSLLLKIVKEKSFDPSIEDVIRTYNEVKEFKNLLERLGEIESYVFGEELKKQDKLLSEYLKTNGQSTSFEISIKPVVETYEDKTKSWHVKSITFTHSRYEKTKSLISNLEYAVRYLEKSQLLDLVSTTVTTDNLFTMSTINNLSIIMMQGKYSIHYMLSDDIRFNDLMVYIFGGINSYFNDQSLFYNSDHFELDINLISIGLKELKISSKENNELKKKYFIYSLENLLCGVIEKTLRNLYFESSKEEKYTNILSISLNFLLKSSEVIEVIGEYNANCIEYYLLNRHGVGQNTRNDFAHYNDNIYDKLTYDKILEVLYLLLMLSNTLFIYKNINNQV